jgi:hypothetical protein
MKTTRSIQIILCLAIFLSPISLVVAQDALIKPKNNPRDQRPLLPKESLSEVKGTIKDGTLDFTLKKGKRSMEGYIIQPKMNANGTKFLTAPKLTKNLCTKYNLNCKTVQLVKIIYKDYQEARNVLKPKILYDLDDKNNPPQKGPKKISFPSPRVRKVLVYFYFSFPPCLAYMTNDEVAHVAPVWVKITHRRSITRGGDISGTTRLYTAYGGANMRMGQGTKNMVCLDYKIPGQSIDPGDGQIQWFVGKNYQSQYNETTDGCGIVNFEVTKR